MQRVHRCSWGTVWTRGLAGLSACLVMACDSTSVTAPKVHDVRNAVAARPSLTTSESYSHDEGDGSVTSMVWSHGLSFIFTGGVGWKALASAHTDMTGALAYLYEAKVDLRLYVQNELVKESSCSALNNCATSASSPVTCTGHDGLEATSVSDHNAESPWYTFPQEQGFDSHTC